jgi:dihydrofolate synthase / folylpolyglutamate synthase
VTADPPASYREAEAAIRARGVEWEIEPSLEPMRELADLLGSPQRSYAVIHITGTNGKTSTAHMIDVLLRARGLRTGRYTSPHLTSMRERICVDSEPLSEERFAAAYAEVLPYLQLADSQGPGRLSFFEVLTAMAFAVFADAPVDVAVVEVGMGGVWDATNVADGSVAVVTPISLDHTRYLGSTVASIAAEKAGIIKPGAVAVLAQQPVEAAEVLLRRAAETGASVAREGIEFGVLYRDVAVGGQRLALRGLRGVYEDLFLPLFGAHQASNAACALAAVEAFAGVPASAGPADTAGPVGSSWPGGASGTRDGEGSLDPSLVQEAFTRMTSPGRLEVVRRSPTVLVDAAHNPAGMAATVAAVEESFAFTKLVGVIAVSADKDVLGMLEQLEPVVPEIVVTRSSSGRSMDVPALAELAAEVFGPERVHTAARLDDAIDIAGGLVDAAEAVDFPGGIVPGGAGVLITGSVVTAGEARMLLTRTGTAGGATYGAGAG